MQLRDSKQLQGGEKNNNNNTATSPWHDAAAKRGVSGLRSYSSRAVPLLEAGHGNPGPPAIRCRNGASAGGFVGASAGRRAVVVGERSATQRRGLQKSHESFLMPNPGALPCFRCLFISPFFLVVVLIPLPPFRRSPPGVETHCRPQPGTAVSSCVFSSQFRGLAAISSHPRREHPVSLLASHLFALPRKPGPLHLPGVPAQGSPQRAVPGCGPLFNWLINSGGAVGARRGSPRRRAAGRCRLPPLYRLPGSPSHILGGGGLNEEALIATEKCPNNFFSG